MKAYQFSVVVTQDDEGMYMAKVPALSGCHTQAKTLPTLYKRINEVIELCLEVQKAKNHPIPREKFISLQQIEVSI